MEPVRKTGVTEKAYYRKPMHLGKLDPIGGDGCDDWSNVTKRSHQHGEETGEQSEGGA
jgi:hypothetical protein